MSVNLIVPPNSRKSNEDEWDEPSDVVIDDPVLEKGFTIMPKKVFYNESLSVEARHIYESLLSHAWGEKDTCFPSQSLLAERMGRSVRTVYKYLCELRDTGLISWERQGLGKPNLYRILSLEAAYEPI